MVCTSNTSFTAAVTTASPASTAADVSLAPLFTLTTAPGVVVILKPTKIVESLLSSFLGFNSHEESLVI